MPVSFLFAVVAAVGMFATPDLLEKLDTKGIDEFMAFEIPLDPARERYGRHFTVVEHDLRESDVLRVLDYSGERAFSLFAFNEMGTPIMYEA